MQGRALAVLNPRASTTTAGMRDLLAAALGGIVDLSFAVSEARGHAIEIAAKAVTDGYDVVVAVGGDGTINEVVNGLLAELPLDRGVSEGSDGGSESVPVLGIVPGGS